MAYKPLTRLEPTRWVCRRAGLYCQQERAWLSRIGRGKGWILVVNGVKIREWKGTPLDEAKRLASEIETFEST